MPNSPASTIPFFQSEQERQFGRHIYGLIYGNPFTPEWVEDQRHALGSRFEPSDSVWNLKPEVSGLPPNMQIATDLSKTVMDRLREALERGARPSKEDLDLYEGMVSFMLYNRYQPAFFSIAVEAIREGVTPKRFDFYREFRKDFEHYLRVEGAEVAAAEDAPHLFAFFYQVRRAFYMTYRQIIGGSMPAARMRAAIWQSIFTHNQRRYRRILYDRMGDITCLITGPSGTGKELVARAIGLSRFIPFDTKAMNFTDDFARIFFPLNLSALSPTLIESEMFGHQRGAFTGAMQDRIGWFEICPPLGTVFLDEIGEIDESIQVKLLRVLETGSFQRLGETETREFGGKLVAATNKDLEQEIAKGRFREDFYFRICADRIQTPSLREQIVDSPGELHNLVRFLVERMTSGRETDEITGEVMGWIEKHLDPDYAWPGNVRELEQCVRNVIIRQSYSPRTAAPPAPLDALAADVRATNLTAEELLRRYSTLVYAQTHNYTETARRLGVDHRTVKSKIDERLLQELLST